MTFTCNELLLFRQFFVRASQIRSNIFFQKYRQDKTKKLCSIRITIRTNMCYYLLNLKKMKNKLKNTYEHIFVLIVT